jgi:hypothetical protein
MKSLIVFFTAFILIIGCGGIEKHYYTCTSYDENGNCVEWEKTDIDPQKKDGDSASDAFDEDAKEIDHDDEKDIFDEENDADYCENILLENNSILDGYYSAGYIPGQNDEVALTIMTRSLSDRKICRITFFSEIYSVLNNLFVETTSLPISSLPITIAQKDYHFFMKPVGSISLKIDIYDPGDWSTIVKEQFHKLED